MSKVRVLATFTWILYPSFDKIKSVTDFTVGAFKVKEVLEGEFNGKEIVAKGKLLPKCKDEVGVLYLLEGEYGKDKKGQYSLDCSVAEIAKPTTREETIAFLGCGVIKGIGPKIARKLWEYFGESVIQVIEETPERLAEVSGISKRKAEAIALSYQRKGGSVREFIGKLKKYDIPEEIAVKAFDALGSDREKMLEESIYHLVNRDIMSFAQIERIAKKSPAFNPLDPIRLEKAVITVLLQSEMSGELFKDGGNLYCPYPELIEKTKTLLGNVNQDAPINQTLKNLEDGDKIVIDTSKNAVYRSITFKAESDVARLVAYQLTKSVKPKKDLEKKLAEECDIRNIKLGDEQKKAVLMALEHPLSVITGFPGTGKTTIQKLILALLKDVYHEKAMLVAPTGRAAKCMMDSTGHSANTIHSSLGLMGEASIMENIPLESKRKTDLLIVDEASMMDIYLFRALMERVSAKRIVIIGDIDQLPSVGCGAVLKDLIETNLVPLTRLSRIYRQKNVNGILINAMHIRCGEYKMCVDEAFRLHEMSDSEISAQVVEEYLQKVQEVGLDNVILLTPYRRIGNLCSNVLNQVIQEKVNPDKGQPFFRRNKLEDMYFRVGDPILLMKNMMEKGIVNGDVGLCTGCSEDEITVRFEEKEITFSREEAKHLDLSYATTVHKSQGSEYKVVLMVLSMSQKGMAKRNILYTGLTRAKSEFSLYMTSKQVYGLAISNEETYKRKSYLPQRVMESWKNMLA